MMFQKGALVVTSYRPEFSETAEVLQEHIMADLTPVLHGEELVTYGKHQ